MIEYRDGYKYQLAKDFSVKTKITPAEPISSKYIRLDTEGNLFIREGYAWDGPSGPAIDTKNFMRGSLVHDALYQLMREGYMSEETWRDDADDALYDIVREDGMSWLRAWYVYRGVRWFGGPSADARYERGIQTAP